MHSVARTPSGMRKRFGLLLFLAIWGAIVGLTHFYMVLHLVLIPEVPSPASEILIAAFVGFGCLLLVRPVADRFLPERAVRLLSWPAFVWMGVSWVLLMCVIGSDVLLSLAAGAAFALQEPAGLAGVSDRGQAVAVVAAAGVLSTLGLWLGLRDPPLRRVSVAIQGWSPALDGFRIVQISDVHIGPLLRRRFARRLVERVNAMDPDLLAITGDLVDGSVEQIGSEVEPMRDFRARHGVFFVTGNHDYFSRVDPWVAKVSELGFRVLRNECVTIRRGDGSFDLAGVEDRLARAFGHAQGEDLGAALAGRTQGRSLVLLAHNPAVFDEAAAHAVDLQISGHTHGGQIWPFHALVRLVSPYVAGLYRRGRSTLYVSRGTGFWGPPMRLFRPGEITELTLAGPALDRAGVPGLG